MNDPRPSPSDARSEGVLARPRSDAGGSPASLISAVAPSPTSAASPEWTAPDGGAAVQVDEESADAAAARAEARAAEREKVRYSWWLPRRMGTYLTGTAGPGRIGGLDAARGLALVGMMAVHMAYTTCGLTALPGLLHQAGGRASILFAVIAGFSLGIMSGGRAPHRGEALVRTRLRILVRSALLLIAGALLAVLGTPVAVILGFYAAWLALALPFLRWRPRNLFILAGAAALFGQAVVLALPPLLTSAGMNPYPFMSDGNTAVTDFFLVGMYPGAVWMGFIFLGLGLSRLDWSRARNLWRLVAVGVLCGTVGYGGGWAVSQGTAFPDTYHLVSPADAAQCNAAKMDFLSSTMGLSSGGVPAYPGSKDTGSATPADPEASAWDSSDQTGASSFASSYAPGGSASSGDGKTSWGMVGDPNLKQPGFREVAPSILPMLATAAPHSGTPFEALGSGGVAMVVIGLFQLISRRFRYALAPLAALGSMSLTIYSSHIVAIWMARNVDYMADNTFFLSVTAGFIVFAMAWFAVFARGPLEHIVHVVSVRSTRAKD